MNNPALMGSWWLWWTNPLVQMHPDQKKRHDFGGNSVDSDSDQDERSGEKRPLEYAEVTNLRTCLGLSIIPEEGVLDGMRLGFLALADDEDLSVGTEKLLSLTLDEEVLKIRPQEWEERFGVTDINQIRDLIRLSREVPQDLQIFARQLAQLCAASGDSACLSFAERIRLLSLIYFEIRLPEFAKRWSLTLSDRLLKSAENLRRFQSECGELLALQFEPVLEQLAARVVQKHEIPEVDLNDDYPDLDYQPETSKGAAPNPSSSNLKASLQQTRRGQHA